jgi:DNA-binding response OmpR family regulator
LSKKRILIVDDDPDMRRGLGARLKVNGYETAFAVDGVSAVTMALKEKPDLILLDLGLPGGNGFAVMESLQNLAPLVGVPVIVISAHEPATHEEKASRAGAQGYFQKPVDIDRLLSAIASTIEGGPPA